MVLTEPKLLIETIYSKLGTGEHVVCTGRVYYELRNKL